MGYKTYLLFLFSNLFFITLHAQNFELIDTWMGNDSPIEVVVLAPDEESILVGHHNGVLAVWDINNKSLIKEYRVHQRKINTIIFNKEKTQFVTAAEDGKITLWEYPSMKVVRVYGVREDANIFAVLSPDGTEIFFGGYNSHYDYTKEPYTAFFKLDVKTGKSEMVYNPENLPNSVGSITDGDLDYTRENVIFTKDKRLVYYNIKKKKVEKVVDYEYMFNNFTVLKDKIYAWADKMLMKLELQNGAYVATNTVLGGTRSVYDGYSEMILTKDEKILVTGDDDKSVNIWDAESMIKKQILIGHTDLVRAFTFCKNDSVLITGGYDGKLLIWSTKAIHDENKKDDEIIFAENNIPLAIKDRGVELQTTVTVHEPEFDIQIWDKSVEDGDSISLNLNGEWILRDHRVAKSRYTVHVKINPQFTNNYLILYAHNLGEISPNTAAVAVLIGGEEYRLSLSSDLKKSGALNFEYIPQ